jgi:membrane-associated phospholipid phosphatase
MPSLHVGAQAFFMFFARRRSKVLFALFAALTAVTFFTSVVSGWHYAIDGYAGLLLAWACEAAGRRSIPSA